MKPTVVLAINFKIVEKFTINFQEPKSILGYSSEIQKNGICLIGIFAGAHRGRPTEEKVLELAILFCVMYVASLSRGTVLVGIGLECASRGTASGYVTFFLLADRSRLFLRFRCRYCFDLHGIFLPRPFNWLPCRLFLHCLLGLFLFHRFFFSPLG